MEEQKLIKIQNDLIADFMGLECGNTAPNYHVSWDCLMPVVQKCLDGECEYDFDDPVELIDNLYEGVYEVNIQNTYKAVVKFIKWHNQDFIDNFMGDHKSDDEIIAMFMGYNIEVVHGCKYITRPDMLESLSIEDEVHYQTSWNWLMPVVDRIENKYTNVDISNCSCSIKYDDCYTTSRGVDKFHAVYTAVVAFIVWLNQEWKHH